MDVQAIRSSFKILQEDPQLVYLDSANTGLTPNAVVAKMNEYYQQYNANIHRGIYPLSVKATEEHEQARSKIANFLNAKSAKEVVFTRNASEAINLVAQSWGRNKLTKGDVVILSVMEHHSNIVPWQLLAKEKGFEIKYIELTEEGRLDQDQYQQFLGEGSVKLVSVIHQSNALGTINPIKAMAKLAHDTGALFLTDGAQSVPHMPVDVQELDSDFFVFTGHKMCGPTGIGVLIAREELLEAMPPFMGGGEMIRSVTLEETSWNDIPYKFEAGTPNIAGAIGLGAAVDYLEGIGMSSIQDSESELLHYALEKMKAVDGLRIFGPQDADNRGATISFELEGLHPHDIASILGEEGVCVRAGNHCAQPLMEYLGVSATTRMSLAFYNTEEDVDRLIAGLQKVKQLFS